MPFLLIIFRQNWIGILLQAKGPRSSAHQIEMISEIQPLNDGNGVFPHRKFTKTLSSTKTTFLRRVSFVMGLSKKSHSQKTCTIFYYRISHVKKIHSGKFCSVKTGSVACIPSLSLGLHQPQMVTLHPDDSLLHFALANNIIY